MSRPGLARTWIYICALALCVLASLPAASEAAGGGDASALLDFATPSLSPRSEGVVAVDSNGPATCSLRFAGPDNAVAGPFRSISRYRHVKWSWRVQRRARIGKWVAFIRCAPTRSALRGAPPLKVPLRVRGGNRRAASGLVTQGSMRVRYQAAAKFGAPGEGSGEVVGEGSGGNPFAYGQCTYYAYERRPDIFIAARRAGVPNNHWHAYWWADNARKARIPVGEAPVVGAIAVFPAGYGGSSVGHVAYVEQVNADGSYVVSERNWNRNPNVTRRRAFPHRGTQFIYGGPAGNPSAPAPPPPPPAPAPAPAPTPAPSATPTPSPPLNRQAVTSYNRMQPGAPHWGVFAAAWQPFVAKSNTLTTLGVTVGKGGYGGGLSVNIRLCTNQPASNGSCNVIGQTSPAVANYGNSQGDIGDVAVTPGATYWIVYLPPQPYGNGWVTYWWGGGTTASTSDQMQAVVLGYNR